MAEFGGLSFPPSRTAVLEPRYPVLRCEDQCVTASRLTNRPPQQATVQCPLHVITRLGCKVQFGACIMRRYSFFTAMPDDTGRIPEEPECCLAHCHSTGRARMLPRALSLNRKSQNVVSRIVTQPCVSEHISPISKELHSGCLSERRFSI